MRKESILEDIKYTYKSKNDIQFITNFDFIINNIILYI